MSTIVETAQNPEQYLDRGLRSLWYPVAASWELGSNPLGLTRLGENIVLWRDHEGQVHAVEDRCPHRGARLSKGWNLGDRLACWYHGVEVNGNGTVCDVPAISNSPMVGQDCVRRYHVQEAQGAIFVWFGTTPDEEPAELELPEQLTDGETFSHFLCTATWRCNYQYAIDNVMDPMHGTYLHSDSHSMAEGDRQAEMTLVPTEQGFIFKKTEQAGVNFDWVEYGNSGTLWLRLSIPYQQKFGPGGPFWIVGMVVPEDADHCRVFFWRIRKVEGWQRQAWRFLYRSKLEGLHWDVLEQDRVILESLAPDARHHENLYQHDVGLSRLRRVLLKAAKQQLAKRQEAAHG
ncbi:aromatic ring-hydroxylating oxygenase subunit alpha [Saccharospirillum salsuginis]|uniref:3-phenylpropionate dioxygenase n=1 Tax=Saccharospirillum salsuginis TaxID=418750 RepID=A0A918K1Z8_9GAMM|nr:aromatic ring-hydroxylating dioxygenase subunit alpha [Saccharospirillum salsuginis]GGX45154.1 3-phenylpropionate dioxygenase [Saccharospirillum salsuginis]